MSSRTAKYVKHTKNPPRTIVSLPMLSQFQETFAIDLKQFLKPLNSLDLLSHLFFRISYNSKQEHQNNCQENILDIDFKILKTTQTFLTDKGGQLPNKEFLEMTKQLEINSKENCRRICVVQWCFKMYQLSIMRYVRQNYDRKKYKS